MLSSIVDHTKLMKEVTKSEIQKVLFSMPRNKSPGPDGFVVEFFKETWSILGKDFVVAIQSLFLKDFLPKGVNTTILALTPKKTEARSRKDYRPISCCNMMYNNLKNLS